MQIKHVVSRKKKKARNKCIYERKQGRKREVITKKIGKKDGIGTITRK